MGKHTTSALRPVSIIRELTFRKRLILALAGNSTMVIGVLEDNAKDIIKQADEIIKQMEAQNV